MGRLRVLSGREVCRILEQHGFTEVRRRGSHIVMQRRTSEGTTTVPVPPNSPSGPCCRLPVKAACLAWRSSLRSSSHPFSGNECPSAGGSGRRRLLRRADGLPGDRRSSRRNCDGAEKGHHVDCPPPLWERSAGDAFGASSGSSSRNSTPGCARLTSPGCPPPTRPAAETVS